MTPDKAIEWAREADLAESRDDASTLPTDYIAAIIRFAELARADMREQCAKLCSGRDMGDKTREDQEARRCAKAIRALKD